MAPPYENITSSESLKFKARKAGTTPADSYTKGIETFVGLKYFCNAWMVLKMP